MKTTNLRQMMYQAKQLKEHIQEGGRVSDWLFSENLPDDEKHLIILEALTLYERKRTDKQNTPIT